MCKDERVLRCRAVNVAAVDAKAFLCCFGGGSHD